MLKIGFLSGLAAGALDFAAAPTIYPLAYPRASFTRIWQSVAEGVLGKASYDGGAITVLIGVALHFFIALCAGIVLVLVMSRAELFRRLWMVSGAVFGVSIYFFMMKVVLPMSLVGAKHPDAKSMAISLAIHILIFGMGSAYVATRLLKEKA